MAPVTAVIPAKAGIHAARPLAWRKPMRRAWVYILSSKLNGTLYVGVTNDIVRRVWEHKSDVSDGFTKQYGVHTLVYFERHETMPDAIVREKRIKKWNRAWKLSMISRFNPEWRDPYDDIAR